MKKIFTLFLSMIIALGLTAQALASSQDSTLDQAAVRTAQYLLQTVKEPVVGSVGGEWTVLGLARSSTEVGETYYQNYYRQVEKRVKDCEGILHKRKYTDNARVILALTAMGKDARQVAGYDLTLPLGDYDKTVFQGINGPIWALLALDAGHYPVPQNPGAETQATRQLYVEHILAHQATDGGWSLRESSQVSDPDITGMALQALAGYLDQPQVKEACEKALTCMSRMQDNNGGFGSQMAGESCSVESAVQMLVALCEQGISLDDPRFVKTGGNLLDELLRYQLPDGSFEHVKGGGSNLMATEQAFYGLVSAQRVRDGKPSLYCMSDAITVPGITNVPNVAQGLEGKHDDVAYMPVREPDKTFPDVAGHINQTAIEDLASRGIINGMDGIFAPDQTMTRAQFAAIVVRGLGLPEKAGNRFDDVPANQWYAQVVETANAYGIIGGKGNNLFDPEGLITRQEAAAMVTRAAELCGLNTIMNGAAVRDTLAAFGDYVKIARWAQPYLAFCYANEILDSSALEIKAEEQVQRCEIAQMLYNLLGLAKLR